RARQLLGPALLEHAGSSAAALSSQGHSVSATALALCFAAAVFPQRAFQLTQREREERWNHLAAFVGQVLATPDARCAEALLAKGEAARRRANIFSGPEFSDFLDDLSRADCASEIGDNRAGRRAGAALHLATCPADVLQRMARNWRLERAFL